MFRDPIPLLPDPGEAHDWLSTELADPAYAEAHATWFDRASYAVAKWFEELFTIGVGGGTAGVLVLVIGIVIIVVVVAAVLIWGAPRLRARAGDLPDALFDDDDERSAEELRRDSERAAQAEEWDSAVVLRLRAVARALRERGAVTAGPGATVHAFAAQATTAFPAHADPLDAAAADFDDVRYLRRPGGPEMFQRLRELDAALAVARPAALAPLEGVV